MANALKRTAFLSAFLIGLAGSSIAQEKETPSELLVKADSFAGAFLAGGAASQDFDFAAASFYYEQALRFDPENQDLQRELMIAYLNNGQFDKAVPLAENLKNVPDIERVSRLTLAIAQLNEDAYDAVQPLLILSQPNEIETLLIGIIKAWAQFGAGNTAQALQSIDDMSGPDWYALFQSYHTAIIADAGGDVDEARKRYDEALNNATGGSASPLTYLRMAEAYAGFLARQGDVQQAKEVIERGLGIAPNNPTLRALASSITTTSDIRAIKDPAVGAAEILLNIGSAINREGAETFASIYLELSRAAKADEPQTIYELATIADRLDLIEKAIALYASVPETSELFRPASLQQGLLLSQQDRNDEAVETLRGLVAENPSDYSGYLALGGVLSSEQRYEEVIEVYLQALENLDRTDERFWPLHYRLGIAYERTKQWPKAEETFKYALTLSPNQADILNYLGYSWIDMNINLEEGVEMIEKAVEMRPRDGYIVDSLGWAHYRLGRFEEAVEALERATDLRPRDPTINDHLGDAYWRVGRRLEAAYQWSQVLEMEGEDLDLDKVKAKLNAANGGELPLVAESLVDDGTNDAQATSETSNNSDGG